MSREDFAAAQQAIQSIYRKHRKVTPSAVVAEARKKSSALHNYFEWDDSKAAEEYRLNQARTLIRRVKVEISGQAERLVHVPDVRRKEGAYKPISRVVEHQSDYALALDEALSKLRAAQEAVEELSMHSEKTDSEKITIALKSLSVAEQAVASIH